MFEKIIEGLVSKICEDCKETHSLPRDRKVCLGCGFRRKQEGQALDDFK